MPSDKSGQVGSNARPDNYKGAVSNNVFYTRPRIHPKDAAYLIGVMTLTIKPLNKDFKQLHVPRRSWLDVVLCRLGLKQTGCGKPEEELAHHFRHIDAVRRKLAVLQENKNDMIDTRDVLLATIAAHKEHDASLARCGNGSPLGPYAQDLLLAISERKEVDIIENAPALFATGNNMCDFDAQGGEIFETLVKPETPPSTRPIKTAIPVIS